MRFLLIFLPLFLWSEEAFISDYEYGEMLYNNPRGVSCKKCHGSAGEGKVIVQDKEIHHKEAIKGADIRKKTLNQMILAISSYHKVMPHYYLTHQEIKAIYDFLKKKNSDYLKSN